jgi:hypothetical protein
MKMCEVLESSEAKPALKPIQPKKSSSRAIKPISTIKSKPPLSLEKLRQKSFKLNVERAREAAKHDREVNKWNRH